MPALISSVRFKDRATAKGSFCVPTALASLTKLSPKEVHNAVNEYRGVPHGTHVQGMYLGEIEDMLVLLDIEHEAPISLTQDNRASKPPTFAMFHRAKYDGSEAKSILAFPTRRRTTRNGADTFGAWGSPSPFSDVSDRATATWLIASGDHAWLTRGAWVLDRLYRTVHADGSSSCAPYRYDRVARARRRRVQVAWKITNVKIDPFRELAFNAAEIMRQNAQV